MDQINPEQQNNSAKFAFFYLLSLVALVFVALSVGMIVFQIINKKIVDLSAPYSGIFDANVLKFAIAAIIIATPIYYLTTWFINKSLFAGKLDKDSGVRRWLTYAILLITSIEMIGWLIGIIYNFLDGDLTVKFILKAITAIVIPAVIFSYYFFDIKREQVIGQKDKIISIYFYASLALVILALIASFFFVESPTKTKNKRKDNDVLSKFSMIDSAIVTYYSQNKKMPISLDVMADLKREITATDIKDPVTGVKFDYKVTGKDTYNLCATFLTSNKSEATTPYSDTYLKDRWLHDAGYQCIGQKVIDYNQGTQKIDVPTPVPVTPIVK